MTDSSSPYLSLLPPAAAALAAFAVAAFLISYVAVRLLPVLGALGERVFMPGRPSGEGMEGEGLSYQELLKLEIEMKEYREINRVHSHILAALFFALALWIAAACLMMVAVGPYIPYDPHEAFVREGILLPNNVVRYGMLIAAAGIGWLAYRWLLTLLAQEFSP
jgi:hypothetical protein